MPSLWHVLSALLLLPASISATSFDCKHVRADKQSFRLGKLAGPKTVHKLESTPPTITNTTFTIDICKPLKPAKKVPQKDQCDSGTYICGVQEVDEDGDRHVAKVMPIAGQYSTTNGRTLDPEVTRRKGSSSNSDSQQEGIIVELHGGKYPNERSGQAQRAIIDFICDPKLTGNEGFEDAEDVVDDGMGYGAMRRRKEEDDDEGDDDELPILDEGKSLQFLSYKLEDKYETLRLTWKTKYACEEAADIDEPEEGKKSSHWGFFTWFLIILFLLAASYIIFGSWLNYNRYGARGWDLIPHGDMIRDLPYTIKDWGQNIVDRLRGGNSRGGYSAV